ncbi:tyrosine-protein kinase, partial [Klebsiella pneumoniae]
SANLAATIAVTGQKVLFIDADLRKGYVHKLLGCKENKGLSEILSGQIALKESLVTSTNAGFDFIGRGQVPPNPAELLM